MILSFIYLIEFFVYYQVNYMFMKEIFDLEYSFTRFLFFTFFLINSGISLVYFYTYLFFIGTSIRLGSYYILDVDFFGFELPVIINMGPFGVLLELGFWESISTFYFGGLCLIREFTEENISFNFEEIECLSY